MSTFPVTTPPPRRRWDRGEENRIEIVSALNGFSDGMSGTTQETLRISPKGSTTSIQRQKSRQTQQLHRRRLQKKEPREREQQQGEEQEQVERVHIGHEQSDLEKNVALFGMSSDIPKGKFSNHSVSIDCKGHCSSSGDGGGSSGHKCISDTFSQDEEERVVRVEEEQYLLSQVFPKFLNAEILAHFEEFYREGKTSKILQSMIGFGFALTLRPFFLKTWNSNHILQQSISLTHRVCRSFS